MAGPPQFLQALPTETDATDGDIVTFQVKVTDSRTKVAWWRCGEQLESAHGRREVIAHEDGWHELILSNISEEDEGEYECRAENDYGTTCCYGSLYYYQEGSQTAMAGAAMADVEQEEGGDGRRSGLLILIDDGSHTDEGAAGHTNRKSLTVSEQMQGIIEDLTQSTQADQTGSLTLEKEDDDQFNSDIESRDGDVLEAITIEEALQIDDTRCSQDTLIPEVTSPPGYRDTAVSEGASNPFAVHPPEEVTVQKWKSNPVDVSVPTPVSKEYAWPPESMVTFDFPPEALTTTSTDLPLMDTEEVIRNSNRTTGAETPFDVAEITEEYVEPIERDVKLQDRRVTPDGTTKHHGVTFSEIRDVALQEATAKTEETLAYTPQTEGDSSLAFITDSQDSAPLFKGSEYEMTSKSSIHSYKFRSEDVEEIGRTSIRTSHVSSRMEVEAMAGDYKMSRMSKASRALQLEQDDDDSASFSVKRSKISTYEADESSLSTSLRSSDRLGARSALYEESYLSETDHGKKSLDVYVAIMDFRPMESDEEAVPMKEGQEVEVINASKPRRWLVRTRPMTPDEKPKEGWVPACYLEKSTAERTLESYVVTEAIMDPKEMEAFENREAVVKELVETEEDFAKDMQFVVDNYYKQLEDPQVPKELRDRKGSIFGNFKDICDFHNKELIKGVQYHAKEPIKLGKTFLRLERDFDMHANYCWNEARAQKLLESGTLKEYFDAHSRDIDDDKTLSDHLKLPIQRLNDYQLLLREIIKYSSRLNEDTNDLQKALDFIRGINNRTNDLQYVTSLQGCKGDLLKLGRIIKHDVFDVSTANQTETSEKYVFLFKGRVFITEEVEDDMGNASFHVVNLFKLQEVEIIDKVPEDNLKIIFRHTKKNRPGFPLTLKAKSVDQKENWIKEINSNIQGTEDLGDQEPKLELAEETDTLEELDNADVKVHDLKHKPDEVDAPYPKEPQTKKVKTEVTETTEKKTSTETATEKIATDVQETLSKEQNDIDAQATKPKEIQRQESLSKKKGKKHSTEQDEPPKTTQTDTSGKLVKKQESIESKELKTEPISKPPTAKTSTEDKKSVHKKEGEPQENKQILSSPVCPSVRVMYDDMSESDARLENLDSLNGNDTCDDNTTVASESFRSVSPPAADDQGMAEKPRFAKALRGVTCNQGETAVLECETEGTPSPSVTWLKDTHKIKKGNRIQTYSSGQKHSLTIKETTSDDAGLYTVVANNAQGSMACSAPLNLKASLLGLPKEDSRPTTPGGTVLPHAPVFKVKLNKETQLLEGTCVRFELVVRGSPEPTVKFYKDDKELRQDERVRVSYESKEVFELVLDHVVKEDAGTYSCVATNTEGTATTTGKLGVVKHKDVFKGLEEGLVVEEREPSPRPRTPKFKWFKNGQDFEASERFQVMFNEEDDSLALMFQHVTPDDAGLYTCVASTSSGSKIACSAELTVQGVVRQVEAPAIKSELTDVETSEGGSAMLELKVTGYPKPKVTWFHKRKEVESGGRFRFLFADEESFTLLIKNVKKDDSGLYSAKAVNEVGEAESSCQLTVKTAPCFKKGLKDMSVTAEQDLKFEVEVDGNPVPEVKWYKDGKQVNNSERIKISDLGNMKYALQISKAKPADSGSYSCVLTNNLGNQAEFSNVVVKAPPNFVKGMSNVDGLEGDTLKFAVEVGGNPKPSLKWSKDGKELKIDDDRIKVIEESINKYSLVIQNATASDVGVYTCEIRNEHGMKASSGNLNIKRKPEFIKKLSDIESNEGDTGLVLAVSLKGYPSPTVKWLLNGADITSNNSYIASSDESTGNYSLKIKKVTKSIAGEYSCEASNEMGSAITKGVLTVKVSYKKPEFDQLLKPTQLTEGKPGKLVAKISGQPKPKIKWLKDGRPISVGDHYIVEEDEDGNLTLTIDNVSADDAGVYGIIALSNGDETKCEAPVTTIPMGQKPKFLKELEKKDLIDGEPLVLQAKISGNPNSIKWQKDGEDVSPSDRLSLIEDDGIIALKINHVNKADAGKYTVVICNAEGKARSAALVEVKEVCKPAILSSLEPLTISDGETGQLKVKVAGEPKPVVKWLKDGKELKPSNRVEAIEEPDGSHSLTIKNARPEDAGKYSVLVENVKGEARSEAPVAVNQAPTFQKPLDLVEAVAGYPAKLEAKLSGSPPPEIKWMRNGKELSPDGTHIKEIRSPDGTVALVFDDCKPEDEGEYTIVAKNPIGEKASDGQLLVLGKSSENEPESVPSFVHPLSDQSVKEGDTLRLEGEIRGNPLPDIAWLLNGEAVKPSDSILMTFNGKKAILEIKNASPDCAGVYQCIISNPLGKASSEGTGTVQPKTAPRFIQQLTDYSGFMEAPLSLTCRVKGFPEPDIEWYYNSNQIFSGSRYSFTKAGDLLCLSIDRCQLSDSGVYECRAVNSVGEDRTRSAVNISNKKEKGEAPMFLKKIGDCEAMEGMTAKFTACITGFPTPSVQWVKNGEPLTLSSKCKSELEATGILRLIVRDVELSDYGEYSVAVSNCHGSATCSAHLLPDSLDQKYIKPIGDQFVDFDKFKKTGIPLPLSEKPRIVRMSDDALTLSWKPSVPNSPRVPVTYQLEMAKHPDGEYIPYRTGLKDALCDVRDLKPGEDYKFRIRVENKYGVSEPSPYTTANRSKIFRPSSPAEFKPKDYEIEHPPLEKIAAAPRFLRREEDTLYAIRGQPFTIEFWVYGYPEPNITWFKDNVKIGNDKYHFLQDRNGKICVFIDTMTDDFVGTYLCHAINEEGEAKKKIALLIAEPPKFIQRLDETTGMLRRCARMQCRVTGVPYPKIKWFKDWHPLYESERIKLLWEEPDKCTLFISSLISRDAGLYSCSGMNIVGSASSSASLNVEDNEDNFDIKTYGRPIYAKPRSKMFEEFYDVGDELGRGTQGIVYHAVKRDTGDSYAAKMMNGSGKLKDFMKSEMDIMNQLCHPKLVRLWDAFETKNSLTLVTDICGGGELLDNILKRGTLTEREVAHYIKQLLEGLEHMHGRYIGHLGLTVGDMLVSRVNSYDIKVGDFGLAARLAPGKDYYLEYGHPEFVAPEIANKKPATLLSDMWSVGVITYLLLSGISPFLGQNDRETLTRLQQGKINFSEEAFNTVTDDAKDFMSKLLVFDPSGRMDVKKALNHKWIKYCGDIPKATERQLNNVDRLRDYHKRWKDWYANASCKTFYRRRTLESCFHHPSKMIYVPGESYTPSESPDRELERTKIKPSQFDDITFQQKINREDIDFRSESSYQNGPDTYLLQLRDTDFPLRLRQYLRVGASTSPSLAASLRERHWGDSTLVIRERRKFIDIMDEEIGDEKKGFSTHTVPRRLYHETGTLGYAHEQMELLKREVWKEKGSRQIEIGTAPYFREKIRDVVMKEDDEVVFKCYTVGTPKPNYAWFRNDGILLESSRIVVKELKDGKCELRINPSRAYDVGVYKCVARNEHGVAVCRARLKIGGKPGRPEAPVLKEMSDTEAYLTWAAPRDEGRSPTLCYSLEYKQTDSTEWSAVAENITHEYFVVRNLQPQTSYQFRIKARNKFGWGEPGFSTDSLTTKEQGVEKVNISSRRKFQQELTESNSDFEIYEEELPELDYCRENDPVPLIEGDIPDLYRIVSEVDRGRFSVVLNVWVTESGTSNIAKIIQSEPGAASDGKQEYEILKSLCHERIVTLFSASHHGDKTVLIMEKLSGVDVLTYLALKQDYNEELVIKIIKQVIDAIEYLHFRNICYIELQPDNVVMVDQRHPDIKLVDFGSARFVPRAGGKVLVEGTLEYLAPEVIKNEPVSTTTDVWCVGVLTYILLSGVSPFAGKNDQETTDNIIFVRYEFDHMHKEVTMEATRFLINIFKSCPIKRPTVSECLENKWLAPSEYMIMKRESARFLPDKLAAFAKKFHTAKSEAMNPEMLTSLGMSSSKIVIKDDEY